MSDGRIRQLERQGNSPALRRAYERAGMLAEMAHAYYEAGLVNELHKVYLERGQAWTLMEKARLWARKPPEGIPMWDEDMVYQTPPHQPRVRGYPWVFMPIPQPDLEWLDEYGQVDQNHAIKIPLDGLLFRYRYLLPGDYRKQEQIKCPSCKGWFGWPAQFRSHARKCV